MVIELLVGKMRLDRGRFAAVVGGECGGHPRNGIICSIKHEWKSAHGNRGKCAAGEVFGCIPHGCARAAGVGLPERSEPEGPQGAARERIENSRVEVDLT